MLVTLYKNHRCPNESGCSYGMRVRSGFTLFTDSEDRRHDYHVTKQSDARIRTPIYADSGSVPGYAWQYVGLALQNKVFMQTKTNGNHSQCREKY